MSEISVCGLTGHETKRQTNEEIECFKSFDIKWQWMQDVKGT